MSFLTRLAKWPTPYDRTQAGDIAALSIHKDDNWQALLTGAAGCSPYLAMLMQQEMVWLDASLDDPEAALGAVNADLLAHQDGDMGARLRQGKRRMALLTGLADLGGVWDLRQVTHAVSTFADTAVDAAMRTVLALPRFANKLPTPIKDGSVAAGMTVLSMGKGGAYELNYSSDIDLIVLFEDDYYSAQDVGDARAVLIKATRAIAALLSDVTEHGYVFRTDLRLRPDPSVTPVCLSISAAERYYEGLGRTWERAAYIKARAVAGDIKAGNGFLKTLVPFIWRRHLDFAAIQDAHELRLKIRQSKGLGGPITLPGHNIKLGRGGIREIEFFTQTRQLIAGGRDETLRCSGTLDGLQALAAKNWITQDVADRLSDHYIAHRTVEHRLQMINDAQTHSLPNSEDGFARLADFMGVSVRDLKEDLTRRLEDVHETIETFFAPSKNNDETDAADDKNFGRDMVAAWRAYPALRSDRAVQLFDRVRPKLMQGLRQSSDSQAALLHFDMFLKGLPAGVQLFSLFEANPHLVDLIVDICATSPDLAAYLSRNSGVLDAVLGGGFFAPWPESAVLDADLATVLEQTSDYEAALDVTRRWKKEWHFRIGVHHLRGLITAGQAGRQYADLAVAVVRGLTPYVEHQFAAKHGAAPGQGAAIIAMGSLGAGALQSTSDLDLIVVYEDDGQDASDGPRPLATRVYYARLTQAFVTALTAQTAEGRLYEVDMRLRPSGRQGPVATSMTSFESYQTSEAWTWEHLALTRARVLTGPDSLKARFEEVRCAVLTACRDTDQTIGDVADMIAKLEQAKPEDGPWDAKSGAGGAMQIELLAQTAALLAGATERDLEAQLAAGVANNWLSDADKDDLMRAYPLFWSLRATARLIAGDLVDDSRIGASGWALILRETGAETQQELQQRVQELKQTTARIVARVFQIRALKMTDKAGTVGDDHS